MAALALSFQPATSVHLSGGRGNGQSFISRTRRTDAADADVAAVTSEEPSRGRNGAFRTKWKSFVHFFALPIRQYYQQPPGLSYRRRHARRDANRRSSLFLDTDEFDTISVWACPTYNCEVGDDEMTLSKAAEAQQEARNSLVANALHIQPSVTTASPVARQAESQATQSSQGSRSSADAELLGSFEQGVEAVAGAEHPVAATIEEVQEAAIAPASIGEAAPDYELLASPLPGPSSELPDVFPPVFPQLEASSSNASELSLPPLASPARTFHRSLSSLGGQGETARPRQRPLMRPSFLRRASQNSHTLLSAAVGTSGGVAAASEGEEGDGAATQSNDDFLLQGSYSLPKRGLTAQQRSFLSSVDSLGKYGLPTPMDDSSRAATPLGESMTPQTPRLRSSRPRTAPQGDYFSMVTTSVTR